MYLTSCLTNKRKLLRDWNWQIKKLYIALDNLCLLPVRWSIFETRYRNLILMVIRCSCRICYMLWNMPDGMTQISVIPPFLQAKMLAEGCGH